nr:T9SS type A sorting domain-containing protein [uncultured Flavobacterium sp.]
MKKITLLFLALTVMLNVANAQDITVFNFDGTTPMFTTEWGTDTFVSVPNPVSDGVNPSTNVGMFTDNTDYANMVVDVDINPNLYRSVQFKVYSPNAGSVGVTFKNATGGTISGYYSRSVAVSTVWTTITIDFLVSQQIKKIVFGFSDDNASVPGEATDVVYLDDLKFIKTASTDKQIYVEDFTSKWAINGGDWTGLPTTVTGQWLGGIDLETTGNANMTLNRWWNNDHGHVVKMVPTAAAVIIPNISLTGFNNLNLSFEVTWPWNQPEDATFYGSVAADRLPVIEIKTGSGSWTPLTVAPFTGDWATQNIVLSGIDNTQPLSVRISNSSTLYKMVIDNFKITGTAVSLATESNQLTDNSIKVYPNPFAGEFNVDATNSEGPLQVSVFDVLGRKVATAKSSSSQLSMGSSLKSGAYIVKVEGANAKDSKSFKIIKK